MQLKEEYRTYDTLRREHDTQIVAIALEAGLRISPEQLSSMVCTASIISPDTVIAGVFTDLLDKILI